MDSTVVLGRECIETCESLREWHNHAFWDKGWNTSISITNGGGQSVDYTINYVSANNPNNPGVPRSYNPSSSCSTTNLNQTITRTVSASGNWSGNLHNDILNPNSSHAVKEDGFMYITLSPVIAGTTPSTTISAHSSGTSTICDGSCPVITSCHQ